MPDSRRFSLSALGRRGTLAAVMACSLIAGCTDRSPGFGSPAATGEGGPPTRTDVGLLPRAGADASTLSPAERASSSGAAAAAGQGDAGAPAEVADAGLAADAGQCPLLGAFVARTPTLYILADRSGTMFDPLALDSQSTLWATLRAAVLPVLPEFQAELRLGFAATMGDSLVCPELVDVPPALNNAADITATYTALEQGARVNAGLGLALERIATELWNDPAAKESYILLLSDGDADFCSDGNRLCPADAVVGTLQRLRAGLDSGGSSQASISTLVAGIPSQLVLPNSLQQFARAGAGQPVLPLSANPNAAYDPNAIYDQCSSVPNWLQALQATGKPQIRGQTVADYDTDAGDTGAVLAPAEASLRAALASLRSCVFDLDDLGQPNLQVDLTSSAWLGAASVVLDAAAIPYDAANGWHLPTATTLELAGAACEAWRSSTEKALRIDLPCAAFVVP